MAVYTCETKSGLSKSAANTNLQLFRHKAYKHTVWAINKFNIDLGRSYHLPPPPHTHTHTHFIKKHHLAIIPDGLKPNN